MRDLAVVGLYVKFIRNGTTNTGKVSLYKKLVKTHFEVVS